MGEYARAHKRAERQRADALSKGLSPYPPALDELLGGEGAARGASLGVMSIPTRLVVGTRTAGRQNLLSTGFMPLAAEGSEFATKWEALYASQVSEGLRDPIVVFEYLQHFYVQEGNKRVSVARYVDMPSIEAQVTRVLPRAEESDEARRYQEFLRFWKVCPLYGLNFGREGSYGRLARVLRLTLDEVWPADQVRRLKASLALFESLYEPDAGESDTALADAFLAYLQAYETGDPLAVGKSEMQRRLRAMRDELDVAAQEVPIAYASTAPRAGVVASSLRDATHKVRGSGSLRLAFVYDRDPQDSGWVMLHEEARRSLEQQFSGKVSTQAFTGRASDEQFSQAVGAALEQDADLVVTVSPRQFSQTVQASIAHPKARFVNCSVNLPSSRVRTFYARMYEVKFLMGALAASLAENHRIGYLSVAPIYGAVSEVNAFALGAALVDPYASVQLEWLSVEGRNWRDALREANVSVVAGVDYPNPQQPDMPYGLYRLRSDRAFELVARPVWDWASYYGLIVRALLDGSWERDARSSRSRARNYWLGMRSGVVWLDMAEGLPEGQRRLQALLRRELVAGTFSPFDGNLFDQQGKPVRAMDDPPLDDAQIAAMSWLAANVVGHVPQQRELTGEGVRAVEASGVVGTQATGDE